MHKYVILAAEDSRLQLQSWLDFTVLAAESLFTEVDCRWSQQNHVVLFMFHSDYQFQQVMCLLHIDLVVSNAFKHFPFSYTDLALQAIVLVFSLDIIRSHDTLVPMVLEVSPS